MSGTSRKLMSIKNKGLKSVYAQTGELSEDEVLLLNEPDETDSIFRTLGIPSQSKFVNDSLKDITAIKVYEKLFDNKEAFKGHFIKKLCNEYFLGIYKLDKLKGYLNKDTVREIDSFVKKFDKVLKSSSFYILAGRECFEKKYYGKEVKTFIIFYLDGADSRYTEKVKENTTLIQITSSGNDWNENRIWLKQIDNNNYSGELPMLSFNLICVALPLFISILCTIAGQFGVAIFFGLLSILLFTINTYLNNHNYKKYWNEKYED